MCARAEPVGRWYVGRSDGRAFLSSSHDLSVGVVWSTEVWLASLVVQSRAPSMLSAPEHEEVSTV